MLPPMLCEELCSLNPGTDRLAFSVTWNMAPDGSVVGPPQAGKSVIRSCAKLAYGHAQRMIEGGLGGEEDGDPPPVELHDEYTWTQVGATCTHARRCI